MTPRFPRPDYAALDLYDPGRKAVEVDLSDNTNLWGPHPEAVEAVRSASLDALARYPTLYADELRKAASELYGVSTDQVATGAGSDDILDSLWRAVCEAEGTVAWASPTFSMMDSFTRMNGRTGRAVPWSIAEANPEALLEGDPVLVYLCRPNNPTGATLEREWIERLVAAAESIGTVIVVDEAYAEFSRGSLAQMAATTPRMLVSHTLSKAYGLAGLRVGFAIGTAETIREIEKSRGPYKVGRIDELAAAVALRDASGWAAARIAETIQNRTRLVDELIDRGLTPLPSAANFLFIPVEDGRAVSEGLRERGVQVRPFLGTPDWGDGLRVTVGPWEMMQRFLDTLDAVRVELDGATEEAAPEPPTGDATATPPVPESVPSDPTTAQNDLFGGL